MVNKKKKSLKDTRRRLFLQDATGLACRTGVFGVRCVQNSNGRPITFCTGSLLDRVNCRCEREEERFFSTTYNGDYVQNDFDRAKGGKNAICGKFFCLSSVHLAFTTTTTKDKQTKRQNKSNGSSKNKFL